MSFKIKTVTGGSLSWREFSNEKAGIENRTVFDILVNIEYEDRGKIKKGKVSLDFIQLNDIQLQVEESLQKKKFINWNDLSNKKYLFPINPAEGYIDGSIYLIAHNPCNITDIQFSEFKDGSIDAEITGYIDFLFEGVSDIVGVDRYEFKKLRVSLDLLS